MKEETELLMVAFMDVRMVLVRHTHAELVHNAFQVLERNLARPIVVEETKCV